MIYFAQAKSGGKIKIGRSKDPEKRLADLSSASPEPLKLLALIDASDQVETLLHRALNGSESHREWHCLTPALQSLLDACSAGVDLGPFLDSLIEISVVKRRVIEPVKVRPKRHLSLSQAERKRRSDAMKKRIKEGKAGGQFGSLGGRPKGS